SRLPVEPPRFVPGPVVVDPDEGPIAEAGTGPVITALADLPAEAFTGVVMANELLDNLPFKLFERTSDGWSEVRVGAAGGEEGGLIEVLVEAAVRPDVDAPVGGRIPVHAESRDWLRRSLAAVTHDRSVVVEYAVA